MGRLLAIEFSIVARSESSREKFAASVAEFVVEHGFDGVDIEYVCDLTDTSWEREASYINSVDVVAVGSSQWREVMRIIIVPQTMASTSPNCWTLFDSI